MLFQRKPWQEELDIVDKTMKAISSVTDPEDMVDTYWQGIGELLPIGDFVALSRRGVQPPHFLVTRSSRFTEEINPWTQRDRLPRLSGGLLGEIAFAGKPLVLRDLRARLREDDPGWFYLQGFESLIALPQYDNGEALNVTCMLLPAGVEPDPSMIPILHWQSGLFGRGTQNLVLRNQLATALNTLDRELQVVGEIQRSLLPSRLPEIPGFDLAAFYQTSARAGGDYYDFFPLDQGRWGVLIADVAGHGTPAAVLMAITRAVAHAQPAMQAHPHALLTHLNAELTKSYTREGTFITAFYAVIDPASRKLSYASAGHNPPRLARRGRVLGLDERADLPIGIDPGVSYGKAECPLEHGDFLLMYTDGITEAMPPRDGNAVREMFGVERVDKVLLEHGENAASAIEHIRADVDEFSEHGQPSDDQTLVAVRSL